MSEVIEDIRKSCPQCAVGMGLLKEWKDKTLVHLDIMYSSEAGQQWECKSERLLRPLIAISSDQYGNVSFIDKEIEKKYYAASDTYMNDITKENYSFEIWAFALQNYFREDLPDDIDASKFEGLTFDSFKPYFENGLSVRDAVYKHCNQNSKP